MSEPSLLEYYLLSRCPRFGSLSKRSTGFHRLFSCAPRYRDYSQMLLSFHSPLFIGYCTMFYVVFVTQLFCLLSRLSGSRVQLDRVIHNRPFGTPTQSIQTVNSIQQFKTLLCKDFRNFYLTSQFDSSLTRHEGLLSQKDKI